MPATVVSPAPSTIGREDKDRTLALANVLRWSAERVGWPLGSRHSVRYQAMKLLHRKRVAELRERCAEMFRLTTLLMNDPTRIDAEARALQIAYLEVPPIGRELDRLLGRPTATARAALS